MCFNLDNYLKVKSKTTSSSSSKTTSKTTTTKVREKKVYSLPGQKHDPPEEVFDLCQKPIEFSKKL